MDAPSTPKHSKHLNRDQRLMVHTLYRAGHTPQWIANHLGFTLRQVRYVLKAPVSPRKRSGRPRKLSPEQQQELIDFVHSSKQARKMSYEQLAQHFAHWHVGKHAIHRALENPSPDTSSTTSRAEAGSSTATTAAAARTQGTGQETTS